MPDVIFLSPQRQQKITDSLFIAYSKLLFGKTYILLLTSKQIHFSEENLEKHV